MNNQIKLLVAGPWACFTRPECKAEKMSYDVITPSAARNVLQAIYWKPEFQYKIKEIHVLKPIRFASIMLNEIGSKGPIQNVQDHRQQTRNLFLRDVSYGITAEIQSPLGAEEKKHSEIFHRRASKGQSYTNPYLGLREFLAEWKLVENFPPTEMSPAEATRPLGPMLLDLEYIEDKKGKVIPKRTIHGENNQRKKFRIEGKFFNATLEDGIIYIK